MIPQGEATIRATSSAAGQEVDLRLLNAAGAEIGTATSGLGYVEVSTTNIQDFQQTFYAHVAPAVGDCIPYSLTTTIDGPIPCSPDVYEPNDSNASPLDVPSGAEMSITTDSLLDFNRFNVTVGAQVNVQILFEHAQGDLDLYVRKASGGGVIANSQTVDSDELVTFTATEAQYIAEVRGYNGSLITGCSPYTFYTF